MSKFYKIQKDGVEIANKVQVADNFVTRLVGLMFSNGLGEKDGLLFYPSNSIHTFFMNYPIDVVFMDKNDKVVKFIPSMKPWRMTRMYFGAFKVLEMMGGTLKIELNPGDKLDITWCNISLMKMVKCAFRHFIHLINFHALRKTRFFIGQSFLFQCGQEPV